MHFPRYRGVMEAATVVLTILTIFSLAVCAFMGVLLKNMCVLAIEQVQKVTNTAHEDQRNMTNLLSSAMIDIADRTAQAISSAAYGNYPVDNSQTPYDYARDQISGDYQDPESEDIYEDPTDNFIDYERDTLAVSGAANPTGVPGFQFETSNPTDAGIFAGLSFGGPDDRPDERYDSHQGERDDSTQDYNLLRDFSNVVEKNLPADMPEESRNLPGGTLK